MVDVSALTLEVGGAGSGVCCMLLDVPGAAGFMCAVVGTVELAVLPTAWACAELVTCGLMYGPGSKDE